MTADQYSDLFRKSTQVDELLPAFQELLNDRTALEEFLSKTFDAILAAPESLAKPEERRLLSCALLLAGVANVGSCYDAIVKIYLLPEFAANISDEEWLSCEISRLLGILSPDDATDGLLGILLDKSTPQMIAEQFLLTLSCRWISRRDDDAKYLPVVQRILKELPKEHVDFDTAMAVIINSIAIGGENLKEQVFAFYHANEAVISERLSEKNLQSFFDLGKQRVKNMLSGNYLGAYGVLPNELERMLHYETVIAAEAENVAPKVLPPITRDRPKIGRNDPCPCGSGKKYKHCCGR